jgi:hypothetical protein
MGALLKLFGFVALVVVVVHKCSQFTESDSPEPVAAPAVTAPGVSLSQTSDVPVIPIVTDEPKDEDASYQCYSNVTKRLGALIMEIKACDAEDALLGHDIRALSILPAPGFKDGVAGVFKKHRLHINQNAEIMCSDRSNLAIAPTAGCLLAIYVSRQRASGKYSDLAGWHAIWFRGVGDKVFRPVNNVAGYLSQEAPWFLKSGGLLDNEDRP